MQSVRKFQSNHVKLDFKDVLIVPKKTSVASRKFVNIKRQFNFKHSRSQFWSGTPIISSNMDTVTGPTVFKAIRQHQYISCFPKHFNDLWLKSKVIPEYLEHVDYYMLSCGISDNDVNITTSLIDKLSKHGVHIRFICLDVANGYLTHLVEVCRYMKHRYPNIVLTAGNVVTPDLTEELIQRGGADIVKCGIGCFSRDTLVLTANGDYVNINQLKRGQMIINGEGKPVKVKRVIPKDKKKLIRLTSSNWLGFTKVTLGHKYLVQDVHTSNISWQRIGGCTPGMKNTLLPKNIEWELPRCYNISQKKKVMRTGYAMGYLVATFLQFGKVNDDIVFLLLNPNQNKVVNKISNILISLFKVDTQIYRNTCLTMIPILDADLKAYLETVFYSENNSKFLATNKSFVKGMHDALSMTEPNKVCDRVKQLFNWCTLILAHERYFENYTVNDIIAVKNLGEAEEVWDIEVDCPTHSFIANNNIVHNSGSVCETRIKAGVGYPQLSAVLECADVAHKNGGYLISDGGIVHPADICKAYAAGADFVMLGSMLAGHTESPGESILDKNDNKKYKVFYGMASENAVEKYNGGFGRYRTAEGKVVKIKEKGSIEHTINDINGSIRSACSYTNSFDLNEFYRNSEFILVSQTHNTSLNV